MTVRKPRSSWQCWNLKLCRDLRRQPMAFAVMVGGVCMTLFSTALATGLIWYVKQISNAPFKIQQLDENIQSIQATIVTANNERKQVMDKIIHIDAQLRILIDSFTR